ncbi:hypothetical protein E0L36_19755 [Streptomyces sp. AJS327]|uniref:DUF6879 family protein n=1 Tax=Streptomyces sp. AJS327 TaxID=2545265 RepID=UPI0015DDFAC0|nr:DUF6879 family protein [Streptomyces sp. AJS327]MBA0053027.1 hypothetical protein [Streptomyces sp. AJS327]
MQQNGELPTFADMLANCHRSAVHLEMRDSYGIAGESPEFQAWKAGDDSSRHDREGRRRPFLDGVRAATARGVVLRRARIVSTPVTEYMRFSHAGAHLNIEAGEEVRWLPRHNASALTLPGNDFWLFDDQVVRFNHFTGDGASAGPEITHDPEVAELCATAFEAVWKRALPHHDFEV